ncbi:type IV secretory system conjugative DNA transfer family protein [Parvibaculaceae bacterium PLY_AMNH_Bact1]|nr:type IV secretory system conjugative DNA transfer family protein [Parvibaculaceae bacterium PLY_AMNH_Bact1]
MPSTATIAWTAGALVLILTTTVFTEAFGSSYSVHAGILFGLAATICVYSLLKKILEDPASVGVLFGHKTPWLEKAIKLLKEKQQQSIDAALEKQRTVLIENLEALRAEQIETLGHFEPAATPEHLNDLSLEELEALKSGAAYQNAQEAVEREKGRLALEQRLIDIDAFFSDESAILYFTSGEYLQHFPKLEKHIRSRIDDFVSQHTQSTGVNMTNSFTVGMSIVGSGVSAYRTEGARGDMYNGMDTVKYSRALQDLNSGERALLRSFYLLEAYEEVSHLALLQLRASIIFNDGTHIRNSVQGTNSDKKHIGNGQHFAHEAIAAHIGPNTANLQQAIAGLRTLENSENPIIADIVRSSFETGNSWATAKDISNSQIYKPYEQGTADLLLGWYEDELPVGFGGFESLVTIARPGTGKTQSQVIPNMLTYPGSIIALDVKGELYETTAATRAEKFGKIIKLDLREIAQSQRYNPIVHISTKKIWTSARPVANLLFAAGGKNDNDGDDGYWDGRARDMVQAFIAFQLITSDHPTLTTILDMLSPSTEEFEDYIKAMANSGNRGLARYANTLADMPEKQLGGIFDHARSNLNIFEDEDIEALTNENDWNPADLLEPGTSLYLCVPEGGIASYAPLLRLIIGQHLDMFKAPELGRPELPLTCFLEELPQLGFCEPIDKATELGRGRGVRLWMFAQDHEQITGTYGQGIIDRCAIEMYMKPADKTAEHLSRILGETEDIFTGEKKPLAPVHELLGEKFSDKVIVKAPGAKPIQIHKRMAYQ